MNEKTDSAPQVWRIAAISFLLALSCTRHTRTTLEPCEGSTPLLPGVPGSPGHLIPSTINPNGASELATLMRRFILDLREARTAIEEGRRPPEMWSQHRQMRCAWPTDPSDRSPAFDAQAQSYLAVVRALDAGKTEPQKRFNAVLDACRACHEGSCPGPIELVEALRFTNGSTQLQ